jgi:hypothetical protein
LRAGERPGAASGAGRSDLLCCAAFAACSAAGLVWLYFTAIGPVLAAW